MSKFNVSCDYHRQGKAHDSYNFFSMISLKEFQKLSPDQKNEEILRSLPLLFSLSNDVESIKKTLNNALDKLTNIETEVVQREL